MQRSRALSTGAVALVSLALLAGCASGGSGAPEAPGSDGAGGDATGEITFWTAVAEMGPVVEEFNASQDDIQVNYEEIPNGANGGYAKILAALEAGEGPDVAGFEYPNLPQFVAGGHVKPVSGLVSEDVLGEYSDQLRGLVTFGEEMYAMPFDQAPLVVYYRQDLLEAAGVEEIPTTWDEFCEAAEMVHEHDPSQYLVSYNPNEPAVVASLAWQAGAEWFSIDGESWAINIDDEDSKKVADYWQGLVEDDLVMVTASFSDEWTAAMADGTTVGVLGASWSAAGIKSRTEETEGAGQWIAALAPSWDESSSAYYGGTSYAITEGTDNPEAAAVFLEWLNTSPEAFAARGEAGSTFPAFPGLEDSVEFPSDYFANDIYAVFNESADAVVDGWNWGPAWDATNTALADGLGSVGQGGTIADALEKTQTTTVSELEQMGLSVK